MYRKNVFGWAKHLDFILIDEVCLVLAMLTAFLIRNGSLTQLTTQPQYGTLMVVAVLMDFVAVIVFNLFTNVLKRGVYKEFVATLLHAGLVFGLNALFLFTVQRGSNFSRIWLYLTAVFHLAFSFGARLAYKRIRRKSGLVPQRSVLIVTNESMAEKLVEALREDITGSIRIAGLALMDVRRTGEEIAGVPVVADADSVEKYVCREWIDEVFLHLPREDEQARHYHAAFMKMGVTVHLNLGTLREYKDQHQQVERMGRCTVLTTSINYATPLQMALKRAIDILGGLVGSLIALLIMACVAIPIKRKSPGPLLYTAERIGLNGKRFRMYKIRSMYLDADARKKELMAQNRVQDGMMFKLDWDPRIIGNETLPDGSHRTGIGEFIRSTSLDEFPQFFNVLKGEMSLVGTRPPTPDEWEKYEMHHRARLATKPGITGMWQVSGRSDITDFEEVVRLDTEYIANWSMGLDLRILCQTVGVVLFRKGAM